MTLAAVALLRLEGRRAGIHVRLNRIIVRLEILQDLILENPVEEVELPDGCIESEERDLLPATEGIEHLFRVRPQVRLVTEVDVDVASLGGQIGNVVLLGIIGHEPVEKA